jgi:hypothetical protein
LLEGSFSDAQDNAGFSAKGATGTWHGAAGTVYLKNFAQAGGSLIIDNENVSTASKTELLAVGEGLVGEYDDNSLTDLAGGWPPDYYVDTVVNVNAQPDALTIVGQPLYTVASNTTTKLKFYESGLESDTAPAALYRGLVGVFDNLEIRGKAKVTTAGDILVTEGDLHSGDTLTFEVEAGASLEAAWLDLTSGVFVVGIIGDITTTKLTCNDCP